MSVNKNPYLVQLAFYILSASMLVAALTLVVTGLSVWLQ